MFDLKLHFIYFELLNHSSIVLLFPPPSSPTQRIPTSVSAHNVIPPSASFQAGMVCTSFIWLIKNPQVKVKCNHECAAVVADGGAGFAKGSGDVFGWIEADGSAGTQVSKTSPEPIILEISYYQLNITPVSTWCWGEWNLLQRLQIQVINFIFSDWKIHSV